MKARQTLTHGSLFSGLGGFDLGLRWAGFETLWQVESDSYCRKVLRRHFPDAERYKDISKCGAQDLCPVDIITGGFPCTEISQAGKRIGLAGKHSGLWWEMHRIICELRPRWCIVENVRALLVNQGGDEVIDALEKAGYAVWPLVVGARILGAPHVRERVWIICHVDCDHDSGARKIGALSPAEERQVGKAQCGWRRVRTELGRAAGDAGGASYETIRRTFYGVSHALDRRALTALGNAVVPQVPMIIGSFIRQYELASRGAAVGQMERNNRDA